MPAGAMLDAARERDRADPLREYRDRFALPDGVIYLDGNSLGALPKATAERMAGVVRGEWGEGLIRSWNPGENGGADWIGLPRRVGGRIARLVGAAPRRECLLGLLRDVAGAPRARDRAHRAVYGRARRRGDGRARRGADVAGSDARGRAQVRRPLRLPPPRAV